MISTSRLQVAAKAALALGILIGLVWTVDWQTILDLLRRAHWGWAAAALLLLPANVVLDAYVWGLLLRPLRGRVPIGVLTRAVLSGFAVGFLTPGRIGEYPGRALHLDGGDGWAVTVSIAVQRIADMAVAVGFGTIGLAWTLHARLVPASTLWLGALAVGAAVSLALTGVVALPASIDALSRRLLPSVSGLHERTAFLRNLSRRTRLRVGLGTTARYGVFATQLALLACAFAPGAAVANLAGAVSTTYFGAFLLPPVTIMDLGIREGAAVFFFDAWAIGDAVGFNASMLVFAINILVPSVIGIPFVRSLRLSPAAPDASSPAGDTSGAPAGDRP
jgi:uncharacterized membrane protein YbhN (UPF0104 family)